MPMQRDRGGMSLVGIECIDCGSVYHDVCHKHHAMLCDVANAANGLLSLW